MDRDTSKTTGKIQILVGKLSGMRYFVESCEKVSPRNKQIRSRDPSVQISDHCRPSPSGLTMTEETGNEVEQMFEKEG